MRVALSTENLQRDLDQAYEAGKFVLHDFTEGEPYWMRASSLAQIALNPLRLNNQPIPTASLTAGDKVLIPSVIPDKPARMVHFGSRITVNAAVEFPVKEGDIPSYDVSIFNRVDPERIEDPALAEMLRGYWDIEMPLGMFGLDEGYDGEWRTEDQQIEYFESVLPGHREILFPNSSLILDKVSQKAICEYFGIPGKTWELMSEMDPDTVSYEYKVE